MLNQRVMIQVAEAQRLIADRVKELEIEEAALKDCVNRYLAQNVYSTHPVPHFRRSGMDGYAIRSEDTLGAGFSNPVKLRVIETIPCGVTPTMQIERGTTARIMTGAFMPVGADAVVMQEMTDKDEIGGTVNTSRSTNSTIGTSSTTISTSSTSSTKGVPVTISVKKQMTSGDNVTPIGYELQEGLPVLDVGQQLKPGHIAILAEFGYARVPVFKQPIVAIFATGSELLSIESPMEPGKIRNSNSYMIAAMVKQSGGIPVIREAIPDSIELAETAVLGAFKTADMVITTGGVSVGDYDIMVDLFEQWEGQMLFNKVAMRPGSPTTAGIWNDKFLFALSGNPGACFVGFELFVRPALLNMQGGRSDLPRMYTAYLAKPFAKAGAFPRYLRGRSYIEEGKVYAEPIGSNKSSELVSIRDANCLVVIPSGGKLAEAGDLVKIIEL